MLDHQDGLQIPRSGYIFTVSRSHRLRINSVWTVDHSPKSDLDGCRRVSAQTTIASHDLTFDLVVLALVVSFFARARTHTHTHTHRVLMHK